MSSITNIFRRTNLDSLGSAASLLCLVHCVLTPIVLALSPTLATLLPGSRTTHQVLIFFVVSLGLLAFVSGYMRHRRSLVLLPMTVGIFLIACGAFGESYLHSTLNETLITMAGSTLLILAHGLNRSFCHRCAKCSEDPEKRCGE
jgi:peptidoglycan/LPS O-acetylase OafA/YrhL